ncbi:MAG TPA: outer membrane lipoprotein carrier protein LolA [Candidatus Aquilonibacter sp.]|nr:outer membrane lipoprotein carrier protein LolA [Candidatus Aquilonibacter sp.]
MRRFFLLTIGMLWLMLHSLAVAQEKPTLDSVLKKMDDASAHFQAAQADFVFDQYQKVVDEHDTQKGTVYYRRAGQQIEMMADFKEPEQKFVLYKDGKLQIYEPKIEQVMQYSAGANRDQVESFLVLGFGGSGQDLKKSFDVTFQGEETVDNIPTAMLQLIPKSEKTRGNFPRIILWIDLSNGISVQQKLVQTQGDYRVAKYSAVNLHPKIGNDVFRLKTSGKTQFVSPRG